MQRGIKMPLDGFTREDGKVIGFAVGSLYEEAITKNEFQQWLLYILDKNEADDLPLYFFDLLDFNFQDGLFHLSEIIGFSPGWLDYAIIYDEFSYNGRQNEELKVVDYYTGDDDGYGNDDDYECYEMELSRALTGIALARETINLEYISCPPDRAIADLKKNPWVLDVFKENFPFIDITCVERLLAE